MKAIATAVMATTLLSLSAPVAAQDDLAAKAATCAAISDSLARLTCFDKAFPASEMANMVANTADEDNEQASAITTAWEVEATKSALDDSPTVTALLMPSSSSGTGIGDSTMALMLRCMENTTSVVLSTTMFMVEDNVQVTVRLDDQPAQTTSWGRSTNYKAVGLWSGAKAIPFVREVANASRLVVRIQERDRLDAEFELADVQSVAAQVASACNWSLTP
ncbi:type VI secretion system-associated protein TagO [Devosia indica]